jgi:hypothetical protein
MEYVRILFLRRTESQEFAISPSKHCWIFRSRCTRTVYDIRTGSPAMINDVSQTGLPFEDADDLADLLNHLQSEQARAATH